MREKFTDSLEKHLSSIFLEKTEQGVLGKHPGTDPTPTFFWGRSQAPHFWATPGSRYLSSGQKSIGSSQRERLGSSREQTKTFSSTSSWAYSWVCEPPASCLLAKQLRQNLPSIWWRWFNHCLCLTLRAPWTVAHQAPLSMGFSRQEYWSGLPLPSPGDLSNPGIKPSSPALQADSDCTTRKGRYLEKLMEVLIGSRPAYIEHFKQIFQAECLFLKLI